MSTSLSRAIHFVSLIVGPLMATAQITPICQVQGAGAASAYDGQVITTTGIVTAIHLGTGTLQGYFIEQPACDGNASTSNGIFVYQPSVSNIAVGDQVQVTAEVDEYNGLTELKNVSSLSITGSATVTPTPVNLPVSASWDPEHVEGMLLQFPQTLVVNDATDWAQYGELVLSPQRLYTPTDFVDPNDVVASGTTSTGTSNVAAVSAQEDVNQRSMVLLDDGRSNTYPTPPPLIGPEGTVRAGSTIASLQAVMYYSFGAYRLEPAGQVPIVHATRPGAPYVGGQVLAASLNVLNFWTTLGGWGAATLPELDRQRTKLVAALSAMDADVFALHELENNADAYIDLLNALNAVSGGEPYNAIDDGTSGYATKSVIFYRPGVLSPCTPLFTLSSSNFQRPHHTQGFLVNATGGRFLFSLMHLRSKICGGGSADDQDLGDGQGCFNGTRKDQVNELLVQWNSIRSSTGINAQLVIGDMNAYTEEDPLDILRAGGMEDLLPAVHSYMYGGTFGALDHALGTPELVAATAGADTWAINSDEPAALDYTNVDLYQPNAYRCSDHDPVLVGLNASALPVSVVEPEAQAGVVVRIADGLATWSLPEALGSMDRIELLDLQGRMLRTVRVEGTLSPSMPLADLAAGAYVWRSLDGTRVSAMGKLAWCGH